jgi:hypothetical protein
MLRKLGMDVPDAANLSIVGCDDPNVCRTDPRIDQRLCVRQNCLHIAVTSVQALTARQVRAAALRPTCSGVEWSTHEPPGAVHLRFAGVADTVAALFCYFIHIATRRVHQQQRRMLTHQWLLAQQTTIAVELNKKQTTTQPNYVSAGLIIPTVACRASCQNCNTPAGSARYAPPRSCALSGGRRRTRLRTSA